MLFVQILIIKYNINLMCCTLLTVCIDFLLIIFLIFLTLWSIALAGLMGLDDNVIYIFLTISLISLYLWLMLKFCNPSERAIQLPVNDSDV